MKQLDEQLKALLEESKAKDAQIAKLNENNAKVVKSLMEESDKGYTQTRELMADKEKLEEQVKALTEESKTKDTQIAKLKKDGENNSKMVESLMEESDKGYTQIRDLMAEKKKLEDKVPQIDSLIM